MSQGLLDAIAGALLKAGANVEIIAAAVGAYAEWESAKRPGGRQRRHADTADSTGSVRKLWSFISSHVCGVSPRSRQDLL
jgi:hypothetical protein